VLGCEVGESFRPCGGGVEVVVCDRLSTGGIFPQGDISCYSPPPSTGQSIQTTRCTEQTLNRLPIEMNTLTPPDKPSLPSHYTVESIVAEKYSYDCIYGNSQIPNRVKEVIIFTFVIEQPLVMTKFGGYMVAECIKDIPSAQQIYCLLTAYGNP
jgi:hypothetical protein